MPSFGASRAPTPPGRQTVHPLVARIGVSRLCLFLAPRLLPVLDLAVHRLTRGRWLPSRLVLPAGLLTTTGHRTGRCHTVPLCAYAFVDGSWLVAATNFGRDHHPAWSTNLLHHPHAVLTWRGRQHQVTALHLSPHQVSAFRPQILTVLPFYDDYATRAGHRAIRVFHLRPVVDSR
ncbi:nitroreductase family deazaflavin-dependent oxidoreductase [Streptomyces chrestomyceticus]|uniref:nitroreductase family deazaflavin-dependent oxidoreductase n=1 Tax=Streptomyces chrestomyceticus TaxID=68185 RepID=UPI0033DE7DB0